MLVEKSQDEINNEILTIEKQIEDLQNKLAEKRKIQNNIIKIGQTLKEELNHKTEAINDNKPIQKSIKKSVKQNVIKPVIEPVVEPVDEPIVEPIVEPINNYLTKLELVNMTKDEMNYKTFYEMSEYVSMKDLNLGDIVQIHSGQYGSNSSYCKIIKITEHTIFYNVITSNDCIFEYRSNDGWYSKTGFFYDIYNNRYNINNKTNKIKKKGNIKRANNNFIHFQIFDASI